MTDPAGPADPIRPEPSRGSERPGHQPGQPYRGPYAAGPPPEALEVRMAPLGDFGLRELARMVVVYVVLVVSIADRVGRWAIGEGAPLAAARWARLRSARFGQTRFGQTRFGPARFGPAAPDQVTGGGPGRWGRSIARAGAAAAAEGAVDGLLRLGPTYVKLGQIIASSPGLFPTVLATAAERCLDQVPPFDGRTARAMIEADLGRPVTELFAAFDETPLSAASIGQVHACVLPDGRDAVIKLQRPHIRETMTTDLRIMRRLARTVEHWFAFARRADATAVVEDLYAVTSGELNPALEAWNQDRFRANIGAFGDNRWVTAPEVYWDYCGPHLICMERMRGVPMDDFEAIRDLGLDGERVLRRGAKTWLEAVVIHGPFHGDLHAGNLWVLPDGRSTFLDFGIMGELPDEYKALVKDLFYTFMFDQDFTRIARAYKRLGLIGENNGSDEVVAEQIRVVTRPMLGPAGTMSLGDFIVLALEMVHVYGMTVPTEMVLFSKQMLYMERYIKGLAPGWRIASDVFLVKNIFPAEAAAKAAELGLVFPD